MSRLALLLLGLGFAPPAPAQDAGAIINRAARVYRSLGSLRADFDQVIDNPMIDSAESKGTLAQAGAGKFSMRFSAAHAIMGMLITRYPTTASPEIALE